MNTLVALIVCSALIASLNPCTLSVALMSISSLVGKGKHPKHVGLHTLSFALGIFFAQSILGVASLLILSLLPIGIIGYIVLFVASLLCIFGLFEIKDYFWYGKGWSFELSKNGDRKIHAWTKKHHSHLRGFLLGIYTSYKLSHYTAVVVIMNAIMGVLLAPENYYVALIWAFWYILPLLFIGVLVFSGAAPQNLLAWKEQTKHTMRLSIGLLYVLLGWIMFTVLTGGLKII